MESEIAIKLMNDYSNWGLESEREGEMGDGRQWNGNPQCNVDEFNGIVVDMLTLTKIKATMAVVKVLLKTIVAF